jgi:hypothetical protein
MTHTHLTLLLGASFALVLSGCSSAKESLGLTRSTPDEFMVVKHAPLAMPPDYNLRPPAPGTPRPQEQSTDQMARTAIFGGEPANESSATAPDSAETALLQQAGTAQANPNIRNVVDQETTDLEKNDKTVAGKLLGIGSDGDKAKVINAREEAERLQNYQTPGETPAAEE